jgi:RNA polymerase sigma factor (sigma-70 family)
MELDKIVQGCKDNNSRAQYMLHKLFYQKMLSVAYKYSNGGSDVQDLVQESFISIYENIYRFNGNTTASLEAWMRVIVKNRTIDLYRKKKNINMVEIHDGLFNYYEQESFYDIFINDISTLIDSLSPQYKKVVTLYYLEEKSHQEIAKILGISVSSSKTNLLRSKIKMKKTLSKLYPSI